MSVFGENLMKYREKAGLTRERLAKSLGISAPNIGFYERGDRCPKFEHLVKIADLLHVSLDQLFGRSPMASQSIDDDIEQDFKLLRKKFDIGYDTLYGMLDDVLDANGNVILPPQTEKIFIAKPKIKGGVKSYYKDTPSMVMKREYFASLMQEIRQDVARDIDDDILNRFSKKFDNILESLNATKKMQVDTTPSVKTSTPPKVTQNSPVAPENTAVKTV